MRLIGIEFTATEKKFLRELRDNVCDPRSCEECPYFYLNGIDEKTCMMSLFLSKLEGISNFTRDAEEEEE